MATPIFYAGNFGTAALGTNEFSCTSWSVRPTAELVTFKNSRSGGYVLRQATFKDVAVMIAMDFDFANNPYQSPYGMGPGLLFTNVLLFLHESGASTLDGIKWTFSSLVSDDAPQSLNVDGKIATSFSLKGNGSYTLPA
jgi:hypothetical protein